MCAINPVHKKRFIIDVYTSDSTFTKQEFEDFCLARLLCTELELNSIWPRARFHLKESKEDAE